MQIFKKTGRRNPNAGETLARNSRGNVLAITAITLPVIVGAMGLGVDYTQWVLWRRGLQGAADAAALAGATTRAAGGSLAQVEAEAGKVVQSNTFVGLTSTDVNLLASPGQGAGAQPSSVEVILEAEGQHYFAGLFMDARPVIRTRALAGPRAFGKHCFLALDPTASAALNVTDGTVSMNCGLFANSNHAQALRAGGNANVTAAGAAAVGSTHREGNATYNSTPRTSGASRQIDPYGSEGRNIQLPSPLTPSNTAFAYTKDGTSSPGPTPNGQCQRIPDGGEYKIDGNTTVNMQGGTYIFCGRGKLNIDGNVRLNGTTGVTIIVTGGGWLEINGNPQINLAAPTTAQSESRYPVGDPRRNYAGLIFWQTQQSNPSDKPNFISGNASLTLQGAFYTPHSHFDILGNMTVQSSCVQLVSKTIRLGGNSSIPNTCPPNDPNFQAFDTNEITLVG